ncbi:UNVERIFIED_CONTAM: hypothetical protein HDU68_004426 [Siphonaria sp. JEL0065]|nr:hypothetical protein HDU68_004426 [Siphonaria sp. JEL0065]
MPSLPYADRQALNSKIEKNTVEHVIAMISLVSMIGACLYILFTAVRAVLIPIKQLADKQRANRLKTEEDALKRAEIPKMDPTRYQKRISELQEEMRSEFEEYAQPGMVEFDAMLDQIIEKEKIRQLEPRVSSLDAGIPDLASGLRRRTGKNIIPDDAEINHREMLKNLREIYDFDGDELDGPDISDDETVHYSNDTRV